MFHHKIFRFDLGLKELCQNQCLKIGQNISLPGSAIKSGLSEKASFEMGLNQVIPFLQK